MTNTTSNADPRYTWSRRKYTFTNVLAFNREDPPAGLPSSPLPPQPEATGFLRATGESER